MDLKKDFLLAKGEDLCYVQLLNYYKLKKVINFNCRFLMDMLHKYKLGPFEDEEEHTIYMITDICIEDNIEDFVKNNNDGKVPKVIIKYIKQPLANSEDKKRESSNLKISIDHMMTLSGIEYYIESLLIKKEKELLRKDPEYNIYLKLKEKFKIFER